MTNYTVLYQTQTIEFVSVAKEFLAFCESAQNMPRKDFIDQSQKLLPLLFFKATLLPDVEDYDEEFLEKFVDEADWTKILHIATEQLGEDDEYVQIQDASVMNTMDYLNVGLSEIYADLYQEMGDFIGAYRLGNDELMLAAYYCCKENFSTYWGIRLLELLKYIHKLNYLKND